MNKGHETSVSSIPLSVVLVCSRAYGILALHDVTAEGTRRTLLPQSPHVTDEETEALKGKMSRPQSHSHSGDQTQVSQALSLGSFTTCSGERPKSSEKTSVLASSTSCCVRWKGELQWVPLPGFLSGSSASFT